MRSWRIQSSASCWDKFFSASPRLRVNRSLSRPKRCDNVNRAPNILAVVRQPDRCAHGADGGVGAFGEALRSELRAEAGEAGGDAGRGEAERGFGCARIAKTAAAE